MTDRPDPGRRVLAAVVAIVLGLALTWQVAAGSFAAYLADKDPSSALLLSPGQSDALLNLADEMLGQKRGGLPGSQAPAQASPGVQALGDQIRLKGLAAPMLPADLAPDRREQIRQFATAAMRANPLSARALRILGQIGRSDEDTRKFMRLAVARSRHEPLAVYWLLQDAVLRDDHANAVAYADIFLRSQPQLYQYVAPALARVAESAGGAAAVKTALAGNPPWRRLFFATLPASVTDARTPLNLMVDMQEHGLPPTTEELKFYLSFLVERKLFDLARYAWLQLLAPESLGSAGLLFNGRFALQPSGLLFDWTIEGGEGAQFELVEKLDAPAQHALSVQFVPGRMEKSGIVQVLVLAPGPYRLQGSFKGRIDARRGLRWRMACYERPDNPIVESQAFIGNVADWTPFALAFSVPPAGCKAQRLRLEIDARSESEHIISGAAWFADLAIAAAK